MFNKIIKQTHNKLLSSAKTISIAESCTGGLLSSILTQTPGSSKYFLLGVATYSNRSKELILNIPAHIIIKYGAVSEKIAILMAKNIRKKINSDFGLSITGIAGPVRSGNPRRETSNKSGPAETTLNKPVGTVFIGLSYKNKNICRRFSFRGKRDEIRKKSAYEALRLLCAHL
ncbi:MAG: CinA family protein [Candidatus Omnitrophota bacterium]|nr:CinA family protein [Candidatus Omnitrophota bacterium]